MGLFKKNKVQYGPRRVEIIYGLEQLFLQNDGKDTLYVVAKRGSNIRRICLLKEYENRTVEVQNEKGERVMITLQSVSR